MRLLVLTLSLAVMSGGTAYAGKVCKDILRDGSQLAHNLRLVSGVRYDGKLWLKQDSPQYSNLSNDYDGMLNPEAVAWLKDNLAGGQIVKPFMDSGVITVRSTAPRFPIVFSREVSQSLTEFSQEIQSVLEQELPEKPKLRLSEFLVQRTTEREVEVKSNSDRHGDPTYITVTLFIPDNPAEVEGGTIFYPKGINSNVEVSAPVNALIAFSGIQRHVYTGKSIRHPVHSGPKVRPPGITLIFNYYLDVAFLSKINENPREYYRNLPRSRN